MLDRWPLAMVRMEESKRERPMPLLFSENRRRADHRKPSVFTWYVEWTIDEIRSEAIAWLMYDAKVPALLCTEISYIRECAPPTLLSIVCDPVDACLRPIDGWGWFECLAELERWALDFNEVDR
jgi:hypothetical protein